MGFTKNGGYFRDFAPGSFNCFQMAVLSFHPLFALFSRFDFRLRRISRMAIMNFQTTTIAAIAMIAHMKSNDYWLFDGSSKNQIYFALLLSLVTLPLPGFIQE